MITNCEHVLLNNGFCQWLSPLTKKKKTILLEKCKICEFEIEKKLKEIEIKYYE